MCQLRRVTKDGRVTAARPTLLRLDQVASHLPKGSTDPGNIVPVLLDGSFTAEAVPLRMNVLLEEGTTAAQRETAYTLLSEADDLFESRDV